MRMRLKNSTKKKIKSFKIKINLNKKNIFYFLVSFSIISIICGCLFYYYLNTSDKEIINNNISKYFLISDSYDYFNLLIKSSFNNIINSFIIWLLGISIIGIIFVLFIFFSSFFSLGFSICSIISLYGIKGIIASICYLFFSKVLVLINTFILTFFAINISIKLFKACFLKDEIDLKKEIKKYYKIIVFSICLSLLISIFEVFVNPFMIKLFTFL